MSPDNFFRFSAFRGGICSIRGSQHRVVSKRAVFPGTKNRNEGTFVDVTPVPKARNEGTCGCSRVPKTGTNAHSPKLPFFTKPPLRFLWTVQFATPGRILPFVHPLGVLRLGWGITGMNRLALSGGMDWWRMEWPCSMRESEKYFSEAEFSRKIPEISQKERFLPNFRLRNVKIQSPKNCNSIPSTAKCLPK